MLELHEQSPEKRENQSTNEKLHDHLQKQVVSNIVEMWLRDPGRTCAKMFVEVDKQVMDYYLNSLLEIDRQIVVQLIGLTPPERIEDLFAEETRRKIAEIVTDHERYESLNGEYSRIIDDLQERARSLCNTTSSDAVVQFKENVKLMLMCFEYLLLDDQSEYQRLEDSNFTVIANLDEIIDSGRGKETREHAEALKEEFPVDIPFRG